jgi:ABC-type transporter Mla MlaB component
LLRISIEQHKESVLLVLEGRLVGPWVDELRTVWDQQVSAELHQALTVVDLCGLTAMDTSGQALLKELLQNGATMRCADVMNQYLVEQMGSSDGRSQEACRPCQRFPNQSVTSATVAEPEPSSTPSIDAA